MSHISVTIEGNLAKLVLSNPPQNRLSQEFFDELRTAAGPNRTDIKTWADLLDLDDYVTFGGQP